MSFHGCINHYHNQVTIFPKDFLCPIVVYPPISFFSLSRSLSLYIWEFLISSYTGLPWWLRRLKIHLQFWKPGFDPWVGKIPWRREWLPTLVFWPGESHGQRSLVGCSARGHKKLDTTERLWEILKILFIFKKFFLFFRYNISYWSVLKFTDTSLSYLCYSSEFNQWIFPDVAFFQSESFIWFF